MNTLTKLALGLMGRVKPLPATPDASSVQLLPTPRSSGGLPLMQALSRRESRREFSTEPLDEELLSDLLWAACGINRTALGGRTAPSAMNAQEIDLHVALPSGLFRYDPFTHSLVLAVASDVRRVTGYQDFVDHAALDLVYVADHARMKLVQASRREAYAFAAAGAVAQNVYLFCASAGLATVVRGWFDARVLSQAMNLGHDQQLLLTQTVGFPRAG